MLIFIRQHGATRQRSNHLANFCGPPPSDLCSLPQQQIHLTLHLPFPLLNFFLRHIQQSSPCRSEKHLQMYPPSRSGFPPHLGGEMPPMCRPTDPKKTVLPRDPEICTTSFPRDHWSNEGFWSRGEEGRGSLPFVTRCEQNTTVADTHIDYGCGRKWREERRRKSRGLQRPFAEGGGSERGTAGRGRA